MKKLCIAMASLALVASCAKHGTEGDGKVIEKPQIEVKNGQFTPEVMWD